MTTKYPSIIMQLRQLPAKAGWALLMGMLHLLAWLPFWALYLISDLLFPVLYYIVRYRRKVVTKNLRDSFPQFSEREIAKVRFQFYRNFTDYIVETIKLLHISDESMRRRFTFSGIELVDRYLAEKRPIVCYFSHCGNWEWAPSITLWCEAARNHSAAFCQIYRPLRNQKFDALMLRLRGRFGAVSLAKRMAFLDLMRYKKQGIPTITGFMSDQKPSHGDTVHVVPFLNHPTAIITGTETVARRLDAAVVYWHMSKPRRGHYHIDIRLITDTPNQLPLFAITDRYASMLQHNIQENPSLWLWTHKRWKHPVSYADSDTGKKI